MSCIAWTGNGWNLAGEPLLRLKADTPTLMGEACVLKGVQKFLSEYKLQAPILNPGHTTELIQLY